MRRCVSASVALILLGLSVATTPSPVQARTAADSAGTRATARSTVSPAGAMIAPRGSAGAAAADLLPIDVRRRRVGVGYSHSCALFTDDLVRCWGNAFLSGSDSVTAGRHEASLLVDGLGPARSVESGWNGTCAIRVNGSIRCWGQGGIVLRDSVAGRQSLEVSGVVGAVDIAVASTHACAVDGVGDVWCWGDDVSLRFGTLNAQSQPVRIPGTGRARRVSVTAGRSCAALISGRVTCWGPPPFSTTTLPPTIVDGVSDVRELATGTDGTCALDGSGAVTCWGPNSSGIVPGAGTSAAPTRIAGLPPSVDVGVGCATTMLRELWCWGTHGGATPYVQSKRPPTRVDGERLVADYGAESTSGARCLVTTSNALFCWGTPNYSGELGTFTAAVQDSPVAVPAFSSPAVGLVGGSPSKMCARLADMSLACWGRSPLGTGSPDGTRLPVTLPDSATIVEIDFADSLSGPGGCIRRTSLAVECWGTASRSSPDVNLAHPVPAVAVDGQEILEIAGSSSQTCARLSDARVRCWTGYPFQDQSVQTVQTGIVRLFGGAAGVLGRRSDGTYVWMATGATPMALPGTVEQVSEYLGRRCFRFSTGVVTCTRQNPAGPGDTDASPTGLTDAVSLAVSSLDSCAVRSVGTVVCWPGAGGATSTMPGISDAVELVVADGTYCVRRQAGTLACWGSGVVMPVRGYGPIDVPWPSHSLVAP